MPTTIADKAHRASDLAAPVYSRIEQDMRHKVETGEWHAGMMIPGRQRLSAEYDVHHRTIDRAIRSLVEDGTLVTQGTRGTFVARQAVVVERPAVVVASPTAMQTALDSPKLKAAKRLGIFTTDLDIGDYSLAIIRQIEKGFSIAGGTAVFSQRVQRGVERDVDEVVAELVTRQCDAIAVVCFNIDIPLDRTYQLVTQATLPVVFASSGSVNRPIWNVYIDNVDAGYQAATHLIDHGCDDFLFVGQAGHEWVGHRLNGVRDAVKQRGFGDKALVSTLGPVELDYDDAAYVSSMEALRIHVPSGVIAANDHLAEGVYRAATELGLTPGREFKLVSFDDIPEARSLGVTSLRPPLEELGRGAARLAVHALNGDSTPQRVCLSSHLIARESTSGFGS
ncbi:MAG TPA: GntR family transcriptional regulator [Capsulimonadaceae bacterium]|jgi:LacI family transcriptional regulator